MVGLFGEMIPDEEPKRTLINMRLGQYHYRKRTLRDMCCGTCSRHSVRYMGSRYHKCELLGDTFSQATDIRVRNICDAWEVSK